MAHINCRQIESFTKSPLIKGSGAVVQRRIFYEMCYNCIKCCCCCLQLHFTWAYAINVDSVETKCISNSTVHWYSVDGPAMQTFMTPFSMFPMNAKSHFKRCEQHGTTFKCENMISIFHYGNCKQTLSLFCAFDSHLNGSNFSFVTRNTHKINPLNCSKCYTVLLRHAW